MITTSISMFLNDSAIVALGPEVSDIEAIKLTLKESYANSETVNQLLSGNNIVELNATPETTVYGDLPVITTDLDIAESQILIADYNFAFVYDKWFYRLKDEDGYNDI